MQSVMKKSNMLVHARKGGTSAGLLGKVVQGESMIVAATPIAYNSSPWALRTNLCDTLSCP